MFPVQIVNTNLARLHTLFRVDVYMLRMKAISGHD
jgi:hypothetical protein